MRARLGFAVCLAALLVLASASAAAASTTIGQLAPGNPPTEGCGVSDYDIFNPTVTSGNSYVVPSGGDVITSWSTNAAASAGRMLTMKVFRLVSGPSYQVVAHDGPRPLQPGLNTFPVSIPVHPGDVVGINTANAGSAINACFFSVPGESGLFHNPGVADGGSADYSADPNLRMNVTAVVASIPSNKFSFGKLNRNKKKGTARVPVFVPGPGTLSLTGKGVRTQRAGGGAAASLKVSGAGQVKLLVKPKGKLKKKLNKKGTARVRIRVTYTPTGDVPGVPKTQSLKIKLNKTLH
jgi:hypothetical protein